MRVGTTALAAAVVAAAAQPGSCAIVRTEAACDGVREVSAVNAPGYGGVFVTLDSTKREVRLRGSFGELLGGAMVVRLRALAVLGEAALPVFSIVLRPGASGVFQGFASDLWEREEEAEAGLGEVDLHSGTTDSVDSPEPVTTPTQGSVAFVAASVVVLGWRRKRA
jgi:hypothetical protein